MPLPRPDARSEVHLGDGLYASYDGHQIQLRAPRLGGDHVVYLEPMTLRNFVEWARGIGARI